MKYYQKIWGQKRALQRVVVLHVNVREKTTTLINLLGERGLESVEDIGNV